MPTPQQLQPPGKCSANLSGNINYVDPSGQGVDDQKNSGSAGNQISEPVIGAKKPPKQSLVENIILLPAQNNVAGKIAWWVIVLALAGAGTWLVKKRYDKK